MGPFFSSFPLATVAFSLVCTQMFSHTAVAFYGTSISSGDTRQSCVHACTSVVPCPFGRDKNYENLQAVYLFGMCRKAGQERRLLLVRSLYILVGCPLAAAFVW